MNAIATQMKRCAAALSVLLLSASILAACGKDDADAAKQGETDEKGLPAPARASGSVTGMPDDPGPGTAAPVTGEPPPPEMPIVIDGELDPANPETGLLPGGVEPESDPAPDDSASQTAAEPTPEDAIAVVRDYYDSINSGSFARAYSLWSDGGRSSGQSPEQFAAGFAETAKVDVEIQQPGRVDAAAGSRYIEVPVAISATRKDGSVRKYVGAYTLRRAVVDGASAEQRAWRIGSADIREVKP
ncbi:hypothetical protein M2650_11280 [Luteimonas sp. SX5]|uniref:Lipoprotein n=1 Tax=Luteimonas galliterrae TaxID=2940486 RepID=A0ABT0MJZ9_9GAMM|nr:hypothetical protein [Luteimonas galliterrae]MCL1635206.1 hypothetical protein [Luteimonas galliterrae]